MLSSRTLFIHPIYNSSHLLIPNFQSAPAPQPSPWKSQKTYSNINMYFLIFKLSLYPSSSPTHISVLTFLGLFSSKHHQLGGSHKHHWVFSQFWRLEVWTRCYQVWLLVKPLSLQIVVFSLCLHTVFPLRAFISGASLCIQISSSYKDTSHIGVRST